MAFTETFGILPTLTNLDRKSFISPVGTAYRGLGLAFGDNNGEVVILYNPKSKKITRRRVDSSWAGWRIEEYRPGKLIFIEGVDSVGKATQTRLLADALARIGKTVVTKTYPDYNSHTGKYIKKYLNGHFGEASNVDPVLASSLYIIDRAKDAADIEEELAQGNYVICDRSPFSNAAFQSFKIKDKRKVEHFISDILHFEFTDLGFPYPDVTLFLDGHPNDIKSLIENRDADSSVSANGKKDQHEMNEDMLISAYNTYVSLAENNLLCPWHKIPVSGSNGLYPRQEVNNEILKFVSIYF